MIQGLNHLTLAVHDVDRTFAFYRDVLGCKPLAKWRRGAYLLIGHGDSAMWLCLSLDPATRSAPLAEYTHTAFHVLPEDFERMSQRILDSGAPVWKENSSEGESLYFLDPDDHKLELHATTWRERIAATRSRPYDDMEFFV